MLPLTECGTSPDGDDQGAAGSRHRVIRPHPNFRLFLTADPSCGEVSRAMRNRCVEICLLDAAPAVAVVASTPDGATASPAGAEGKGGGATAVARTEHVADLLSLVRAAGLTDPAEATAAVAAHSALVERRSKGRANASAGEGPASRCLLLWAELVAASRSRSLFSGGNGDVLRRSMPLAYPGLSPGAGSSAEDKIVKATLAACLAIPDGPPRGLETVGLLESLVSCGWKYLVDDSAGGRVAQGLKLLQIVSDASGASSMNGAARGLLSLVIDQLETQGGSSPVPPAYSDLFLEPDDADLLHAVSEACSDPNVSTNLVAQAIVLFARNASSADRQLRRVLVARLPSVSAPPRVSSFERGALVGDAAEAVAYMMSALYDSRAWREVSTMLPEMLSDVCARIGPSVKDLNIASIGQAASVIGSYWSPSDPRLNPDLFRAWRRACHKSVHWAPGGLLLRLVDASVGRRLPLLLAERAELTEARARISSGHGGEAGLGWLGLSCLICDGGRDSRTVGGGARCSETRLARSALAPYLLPLLRAVDGVVELLVCRQAAESFFAEGEDGDGGGDFGKVFVGAVQKVLDARDSVSRLLTSSRDDMPGADASAGGVEDGGKGDLLFAWDPFLVSWRWLQQAIDSLQSVLSGSSGLEELPNVSPALATLGAIAARVDAAVLQHAGGAEPTRDTLWKHGHRAAAPSSAAGAISLARIGRLADEFRILPASASSRTYGVGAESAIVSLGSLMREAHPALCVPIDTRHELLHALCTLHWAASNEQVDGPSRGKHPFSTNYANGLVSPERVADSSSLAERLPGVLEDTLKSARARFEAGHKGTRLGAAERQDDGLEHHQDDLEFGEKFDDFDTEAAEAVANATLLVVSGDHGSGGTAAGDSAGGGEVLSGGVLQDWAVVQLSPLMEHWIALEECHILSLLADLDVSRTSGSAETPAATHDIDLPALMARIARLRSAILAAPSLSPAAARPHQTLLWAWADSNSWPDVHGPLLKRLLPVALDSFGHRLWENMFGTPGALSFQLAPPEMIAQSTADGHGGQHGRGAAADSLAFLGPVQLLTLARSSFLLRLLATPTFRGGVVPCGVGGERHTAMDLTLINASARLDQFRVAMRGVRDLAYGGGGSGGALKPLVQLSWARLRWTLGAFDGLVASAPSSASGSDATLPVAFASAVAASRSRGGGVDTLSWKSVEGPLRSALASCSDERLTGQADFLVIPAVRNVVQALEGLGGPNAAGPTPLVQASAGLGMALVGCLRLVLLLPSSPVDPGLRPALKKELLGERMGAVKAELTVRRWSLALGGEGAVSPEVRCLRVNDILECPCAIVVYFACLCLILVLSRAGWGCCVFCAVVFIHANMSPLWSHHATPGFARAESIFIVGSQLCNN